MVVGQATLRAEVCAQIGRRGYPSDLGAVPWAGLHYPGSYGELRAWFLDDAACLDYLDWLRWPNGFVCPHCGGESSWEMADGVQRCARCRRRVSRTAGTIFQDTRTRLTVWFAAAWQMVSQKHGISALGLQRVLGLGSYQTAWAMLHRYRAAMVRPGREQLGGLVEVDETWVGGIEKGKHGRDTDPQNPPFRDFDLNQVRARAGGPCHTELPRASAPRHDSGWAARPSLSVSTCRWDRPATSGLSTGGTAGRLA